MHSEKPQSVAGRADSTAQAGYRDFRSQTVTQPDRSSSSRTDASVLNRQGLVLESLYRFDEAKKTYKEAIRLDPHYADSFFNLAALIYQQTGAFDEAVRLCRQAIEQADPSAKGFVLLGCIYQSRSMWDHAEQCHRQALELEPALTEAHQNLGLIYVATNRHLQAVTHFEKALSAKPDCSRTWNDLGISLHAAGRHSESLNACDKALRLTPDFDAAWYHKGNVLQDLGQFEQAANAYSRAVKIKPHNALYWNNLGVVRKALGQNKRAMHAFRKAIEHAPQTSELYNNLGLALQAEGRPNEAISQYEKAIELRPDFAAAWRNMGDSYKELCRLSPAISCYRKALSLRPGYKSTRWNLSLALLLDGQMEEGFSLYKYRKEPDLKIFTYSHSLPKPQWDGRNFSGQTLLVHCEQGFGDSIHFVRYLPLVSQRGGRVVLETQPALVRLFEQSRLADQVIAAGDAPPDVQYDVCCSIMDLPAVLKTTLDTIPEKVPYLRADTHQTDLWSGLVSPEFLKVGIIWAGNPSHGNDKNRSCPPELFFELSRTCPQTRFYSLQKGLSADTAAKLTSCPEIIDLQHYLKDFADTAAVMQCLDLIITVDTSAAHLAGALGRPVWTLLPFSPDWRWLLDRNDSPWYPTMRLFRQDPRGDWPGVFRTLQSELDTLGR